MSITIEDLIESAQFRPSSINFPGSWCGHLPFAYWIIKQKRPNIFVELGTHTGNSYFSFCQAVQSLNIDSKCFAVDTWEGDEHAGTYDESVFENVVNTNKRYSIFSNLLRMTFDEAVSYFSDDSIDLLHIDGLHTYEAVKHDFETWLPKLSKGAVVLFHDTNVRERNFGVWRLWEELKLSYPNHLEFLHSHGLGILQVETNPGDEKLTWLLKDRLESKNIEKFFSALGQKEYEIYHLLHYYHHNKVLMGQVQQYRKEAEELQQLMTKSEAKIEYLTQRNVELQPDIVKKENEIKNLKLQVFKLTSISANRDDLIRSLESSTSWRITRPLRWVAHKIKVHSNVLPCVFPALKNWDGIKRKVRLARELYKSQGIEGIKRGVYFLVHSKLTKSRNNQIGIANNTDFNRNNYAEWVRRYDTITVESRIDFRTKQDIFGLKPKISVVMPTFNSKIKWLIEAIESVRKQIYPHWELCIADDASSDPAVRRILEEYLNSDNRIKVAFRAENGHISAASNTALEIATGEWIALLDHDDILNENALYWVTDAINKNPNAKLIYSDEDKISEAGVRSDPYFKCDWNPDLFLSHNMISHLGVYRRCILQKIGGFRSGFEGAQDYDLALRVIEKITAEQIIHIPRVLYHWRVHSESTAMSVSVKPYAIEAGERAINQYFLRKGIPATVKSGSYGYIPTYILPNIIPLVSIIIPTRNGIKILRKCIESIISKTTYRNYEILIVDNGSNEVETLDYLNSISKKSNIAILCDDKPFNYSRLNNVAVQSANGQIIALLNNDIEIISPNWLEIMVSHALRPEVGAVGAKLWYPNNTLQHGGLILGLLSLAGHSHKNSTYQAPGYFGRLHLTQNLSAVTGACLVIKKSVFLNVGGLDETNLTVAFNDVDFCLRVRDAGYWNVWTPDAQMFHHESVSRGLEDTPEKQVRFFNEILYMKKRWGDQLNKDPAYSPNLTLDAEDFSYAWPPRLD